MSILSVLAKIFSFLSGFDSPLLKEGIGSRLDQLDVCAEGCDHR